MKVLVIRYGSMGDILLTTPVIRTLFRQLNARIYLLTKKKYTEVLQSSPYIHKILSKEDSCLTSLKNEDFDYIVDLQKNIHSTYLRLLLQVPSKAYKKHIFKKWLLLFSHNKKFTHSHVVDRYLATIEHLGVKNDGRGLEFTCLEDNLSCWDHAYKKKIVIAMGGTYITKRIPVSVIEELTTNSMYEFVLIGGKDVDTEGGLTEKTNVKNLIGITNLNESANIISQCDLVISGDTGMMHLASALQKPMIVIWGSTSSDFGFSPYYGNKNTAKYISIQNEDLTCRPCSKYGRASCPKGHMNCLNLLTANEIDVAIMKILG